eukprot:5374857-Amphidinium_carterae.1
MMRMMMMRMMMMMMMMMMRRRRRRRRWWFMNWRSRAAQGDHHREGERFDLRPSPKLLSATTCPKSGPKNHMVPG